MQAFPNAWSSFVEVQGMLQPASPGGVATLPLSRIVLEARYGKEAWNTNVWAVGARIDGNCRYLQAIVLAGKPTDLTLGEGTSISVHRTSEADPGTLTVTGKAANLCLLFAPPKGTVGPAVMTFGSQRIALGDALRPAEEVAQTWFDIAGFARAQGTKIAAIAVALAALGAGIWAGTWLWRRRRRAVILHNESDATLPMQPTAESPAPAPIEAPAVAPSELQVSARHCRLSFAPVAASAGPGLADFEAGQRALQVNSNQSAEDLLARAIAAGLDPTYACGAWAFRGKAALRQGRVEQAIRCFLGALEGDRVTHQAAHLAASHLAVIYRELGWRSDARFMEQVTAAAGAAAVLRDKAFVATVKQRLGAFRPPK